MFYIDCDLPYILRNLESEHVTPLPDVTFSGDLRGFLAIHDGLAAIDWFIIHQSPATGPQKCVSSLWIERTDHKGFILLRGGMMRGVASGPV